MLKVGGATNCTWPAYSAPDSPPIAAPITNAHSLNRNVLTPMTSAASSSSRMATQARPTRLRSRLPTSSRMPTIRIEAQPEPPRAVVGVARRVPAGEHPVGQLLALPELAGTPPVEAARTVGDVGEVVGQQPDDLAESQRDDGQVVAAQPQRRRAQDQAGQRGEGHRQRHTGQPRPVLAEHPVGPIWFHGLFGLVSSATVYAPTA